MVKGISRQVILVQAPDTQLFEQAIFILKDNAEGITDEQLLREAKRLMNSPAKKKVMYGPFWAAGGAIATALIWLATIFL